MAFCLGKASLGLGSVGAGVWQKVRSNLPVCCFELALQGHSPCGFSDPEKETQVANVLCDGSQRSVWSHPGLQTLLLFGGVSWLSVPSQICEARKEINLGPEE